MVYSPSASPCQPTCVRLTPLEPCDHSPVEGCICQEGLVMDGDRCVEPEECGCKEDGLYYSVSSFNSSSASHDN